MNVDVVVIGAGVNGLTAAAALARAGRRVQVLEKRDVVGGVAASEEVFPGLFAPLGLHGPGGLHPRARQVAGVTGDEPTVARRRVVVRDGAGVALEGPALQRLAAHVERLAGPFGQLLARPPPDADGARLRDLFPLLKVDLALRKDGAAPLYELLRALPMPLRDLLGEWLDDDHLRAGLALPALCHGRLGPRAPGTGLHLVYHSALELAGRMLPAAGPRGGVRGEMAALAGAARSAGASIRTGCEVERILLETGVARGVVTRDGEEIRAGRVLSAADPVTTLLGLLDAGCIPPAIVRDLRSYRIDGTCARIFYRVDRLPPFLDGADGAETFAVIADGLDALERVADAVKYGELPEQPALEVTAPQQDDGAAQQWVLSVQVHAVPHTPRAMDWEQGRDELERRVRRQLTRHDPSFADSVQDVLVLAPPDLEERLGVRGGHLHQGDVALDQMLLLRPTPGCPRFHTPVEGLFLGGAGTHPGGGLHGLCGVLAAQELRR